jgi:Ca2+-binding RTX toxin-like protein
MVTIKGTQFADELYGTAQADNIDGLGGDDVIEAGGGNDVVLGGIGRDALHGDDGDDRLEGGSGNDYLGGGVGIDTMIGGLGNDIYEVDDAGDVIIELADEGIDTVSSSLESFVLGASLENLHLTGSARAGFGNALRNNLTGNSLDNVLDGGDENDILDGQDGSDYLVGGSGNDILYGGGGSDRLIGDGGALFGGPGSDMYWVNSVEDVVTEYADEGTDFIYSAVDFEVGPNVETLSLWHGSATRASGNDGNNVLEGNESGNIIEGRGGADSLLGRSGNDTLNGGGENDLLQGDRGADTMTGGAGADTFVIGSLDDTGAMGIDFLFFNALEGDRIDLRHIDANSLVPRDQAFHFIGNNVDYTGTPGDLRFNFGSLEGDVDGDGRSDFWMTVEDPPLMESAFLSLTGAVREAGTRALPPRLERAGFRRNIR